MGRGGGEGRGGEGGGDVPISLGKILEGSIKDRHPCKERPFWCTKIPSLDPGLVSNLLLANYKILMQENIKVCGFLGR
jgi:hypothetical protein